MSEELERRMQQELRSRIDEKLEGLRDQFAMAALTGLLAAPDSYGNHKEFAEYAYTFADAMMKER